MAWWGGAPCSATESAFRIPSCCVATSGKPRSPNLFLGSGLFPVRHAKDPKRPIHVGFGTDVGAGTSFSLLATLNEAYKISQLLNAPIGALEGLYLATLGGARALDLEDRLGSRTSSCSIRRQRRYSPSGAPLARDRGDAVRADDPRRRSRRARHLYRRGACPCA
jgi:hypothetical protein